MRSSNRMLRFAGASLVVTAVSVASSASADPKLPEKLRADLGMPCTPGCIVCHNTAAGGPGNIRNATNGGPGFGATLVSYGLNVVDVNTLEKALKNLEAARPPSDIDGDGTSDIDELKQGDDPNDETKGASVCSQGPEFGCVRVARQGPVDDIASVASAAVLALGVAAFRRRRAR